MTLEKVRRTPICVDSPDYGKTKWTLFTIPTQHCSSNWLILLPYEALMSWWWWRGKWRGK